MRAKQLSERLQIETTYQVEMNHLQEKWNDKLNHHRLLSTKEMNLMQSRHASEREANLLAAPKRPKPSSSSELLMLRHLIRAHAKQKK